MDRINEALAAPRLVAALPQPNSRRIPTRQQLSSFLPYRQVPYLTSQHMGPTQPIGRVPPARPSTASKTKTEQLESQTEPRLPPWAKTRSPLPPFSQTLPVQTTVCVFRPCGLTLVRGGASKRDAHTVTCVCVTVVCPVDRVVTSFVAPPCAFVIYSHRLLSPRALQLFHSSSVT